MRPSALASRSLAPDLARGLLLLLVAMVHANLFRSAWTGSEFEVTGTVDTIVTATLSMFGEERGFSLFAMLFGYGAGYVYLRNRDAGKEWLQTRGLLRRRGRWLIVFGLLHTVLLTFGDVLAVYGLITLIFAGALQYTNRKLLAHAFTWLGIGTFFYAITVSLVFGSLAGADEGGEQVAEPTYLSDMLGRLAWPVMIPLVIATAVFPFLIGIWAAKQRLLDEPERNRVLLRRVAVYGIGFSTLAGIPFMLYSVGAWEPGPLANTFSIWLQSVGGYGGGFGYAALIGLIAIRLARRERQGVLVTALAATGQRSLTCYLLQSVAWLLLAPPYLLGLGYSLSDLAAALTGAAVWAATVVAAYAMHLRGNRGPAETLYRRLTYK